MEYIKIRDVQRQRLTHLRRPIEAAANARRKIPDVDTIKPHSADLREPAILLSRPHWSYTHVCRDLARLEPMPIHALTGSGRHNGLPDNKSERRGGSSLLLGHPIRFSGRASQCIEIESLHSIDSTSDIVFGYLRLQEMLGRTVCNCCCHGARQSDYVSHWIAEVRPDWLNEILRATTSVAHNTRQAARHCLIDDETPSLSSIARKNETIGSDIRSTDFGLVEEAHERSGRSIAFV